METEKRTVAARGWVEGNGVLVFRAYGVSVWKDEKVLEKPGAGGEEKLLEMR